MITVDPHSRTVEIDWDGLVIPAIHETQLHAIIRQLLVAAEELAKTKQ